METDHITLDADYDRALLEDVFDQPDLRYVALYMFILRKELFHDMEDDAILECFETLVSLDEPTVGDLQRYCTTDFIKALINFHVISNIKSFNVLKMKSPDFKIRLAKGIKIAREDISEMEEEFHLFCQEDFLERVIAPNVPEMTQTKILKALERLRAMMCPRSSTVHKLIHKYGDHYVLDDDFFYIIEDLGNPYQALRIEMMIRAMGNKYKEIGKGLILILDQFDPNLAKKQMMDKCRKKQKSVIHGKKGNGDSPAQTGESKVNFLDYLVKKSRKRTLPLKFRVEFPEGEEIPEIYREWKTALNNLIRVKLDFEGIDKKMDDLRAYYSGKNQIMPYMTFIEKATFDEDDLSEEVRTALLEARNGLKKVNDMANKYSKRDMKILNLNVERMIIEEGLDEEEEDD